MPMYENVLLENYTPNQTTNVRYWATEFEHPHAGNRWQFMRGLINEVKHDSTVPSVGEDCSCEDCAHDCNCRNCQQKYRTCSNAGKQELTMIPYDRAWSHQIGSYIEALAETEIQPDDFSEWCGYHESNQCEYEGEDTDYCESEDRSSWGFHTHLDARDLTIRQVATASRLLTAFLSRFEDAFGFDYYNTNLEESDLERVAEGKLPWGRARVNPAPIIRYFAEYQEADREDPSGAPRASAKATIEIRQLRYTDNPRLHEARVAFCRAVLDYVAENKPVFYLIRETDLAKVCQELEIGKH
jgi:hypothetical protein